MLRAVDALMLDPSRGDVTADAVEGLAQAVRGGLAAVVRALERDRAGFAETRGELERNGAALRIMQLTMTSWRRMIDNYGLAGSLAALPGFDAALEAATTQISGIGPALEACASDAIRLDRERIEEQLHRAVRAMRPGMR